MPKTITGSPMYELKVTNPNAISNYNGGHLVKAIGDDLVKFVGKPMQGLVVKEAGAAKIVDLVKKDLIAKKVKEPVLRAGISGSDILFVVSDLKNAKYEQSCVLVAGYVPLREKLKKQAATVVNLDPGDAVIDQAAKDMARNNRAGAVAGAGANFGLISGTSPIILLAHGDEDKTSTGQIYGKDFAGKTPAQLVTLLVDNADPKRCLSRDYAGTIYLDGCFTAQGGAMQNYTKQVWEMLKTRGVKNVKVKGNLGLAATTDRGDEIITTSEAQARADRLLAGAKRAYSQATVTHEQQRGEIWQARFGRPADEAAFLADPEVKRIDEDAAKISERVSAQLEKELKKIPGYQVPNLVGQFGLTRLN